ncbi:MAG TPA: fumarylacetoacetate hydrolase family protein [Hyphomicrobiales bacterium]|nr:fumarylacetoacetate hydrolase family protein [Hyphomicrobiales bacterium]
MAVGWSLASAEVGGRSVAAAICADGRVVSIDVLPPALRPLDVVSRWGEYAAALQGWSPDDAPALSGFRLRAPLQFPPKVICAGANYRDHRREMNTGDSAPEPFFFLKPPTTTVIGPDEDVLIRDVGDKVDWEAEIAVVIGRGGRFIPAAKALDHVAGYTLLNDISARAVHQRAKPLAPAFAYDWLASKGQDTFCPLGPGITPRWLLPDCGRISFQLTVNGVVRQASSTAELITDIPGLIAAASELMALEPGDVIATGTPGGVGAATGDFLKNGDVMTISAPGIGSLTNRVRLSGRTGGFEAAVATARS